MMTDITRHSPMPPLSHPPAPAQPHISPTQSPSPLTQPPAIVQPHMAPKQLTNCQTYQCLHYVTLSPTPPTHSPSPPAQPPAIVQPCTAQKQLTNTRYTDVYRCHALVPPSAAQPPAQPLATSATYASNIRTGHNAPYIASLSTPISADIILLMQYLPIM
jgi:hypothetical protein